MISRDGLREILISSVTFGLAGAGALWAALTYSPWYWVAAVPLLFVWVFSVAFFRDPPRNIPQNNDILVSPADGTITEIKRLDQYEGINGPAIRIGIFLSIFNVHVNRTPCSGRVVKTEYRPGQFLDARHPECGLLNEANTIVIAAEDARTGPVIVRQITGLIARRIVCRLRSGDSVKRGQRFGLLKFGSRTELIVAASSGFEPAVEMRSQVRGGSTILMRRRTDPRSST